MYYHLVLVTKYRRKVIDNQISEYAKGIFERIAESYHITLIEWNHDKDHIHIMFKGQPKTELTKFIKKKSINYFLKMISFKMIYYY